MKELFYTVACLVAGLFAAGCSEDETPGFGSVYGIVTDADTHQPVYGASVTLSPGNLSTTTGDDGHFEFTELEAGQYKLQIQASGYQTNSRQLQVNAGGRTTGDMILSPETATAGIRLSSNILDFDTSYSELTLSIRNTGNAGTVSWYISGLDVSWLTISPMRGETAMGQSSEVKAKIDRAAIASSQTTYFLVNAAGGSQSVTVNVGKSGGSDENPGGGGDNPGGGDQGGGTPGGDDNPGGGTIDEDYSSATVSPGDTRIEAAIVSCKRSGSTVVFTYTLTNDGLGSINDWRIYPPDYYPVISGGYLSVITDNEGNEYRSPGMTFRGQSNPNHVLTTSFPEGVPCKGTVTLTSVPASVKSISVMLGVYAYPDSQYHLQDKRIHFKNVPIY